MILNILIILFAMTLHATQIISHEPRESSFQKLKDKILQRGDLPHVSVADQLNLVESLSDFELGKFILERGGLNGYWTHYIVTHPEKNHLPANSTESFILNQAPTCLATQQRYAIFKTLIQQQVRNGGSFASIPCGLMGEFLDLDFSSASNCSLHGIDLDLETLSQARAYAQEKGLVSFCNFSQQDAWNLGFEEEFDLIASNGLSIYEPNDKKVVDLFTQFYRALKPNGTLITSFLTPPPPQKTEWKLDSINLQDALKQKIIFADILEVKWQVFRAEETIKALLKEAGFSNIEIFYDSAHIFPTVAAYKV